MSHEPFAAQRDSRATYYIIAPIRQIALNGAALGDIIGLLAILIVLIALLAIGLGALVRGQQRRQAWAGV